MEDSKSRAREGDVARAIELLDLGEWRQAHEIVQQHESVLAAWLHGIVHTQEGDLDNARYWYRRAGRVFPGPAAMASELGEARRTFQEGGGSGRAAPAED